MQEKNGWSDFNWKTRAWASVSDPPVKVVSLMATPHTELMKRRSSRQRVFTSNGDEQNKWLLPIENGRPLISIGLAQKWKNKWRPPENSQHNHQLQVLTKSRAYGESFTSMHSQKHTCTHAHTIASCYTPVEKVGRWHTQLSVVVTCLMSCMECGSRKSHSTTDPSSCGQERWKQQGSQTVRNARASRGWRPNNCPSLSIPRNTRAIHCFRDKCMIELWTWTQTSCASDSKHGGTQVRSIWQIIKKWRLLVVLIREHSTWVSAVRGREKKLGKLFIADVLANIPNALRQDITEFHGEGPRSIFEPERSQTDTPNGRKSRVTETRSASRFCGCEMILMSTVHRSLLLTGSIWSLTFQIGRMPLHNRKVEFWPWAFTQVYWKRLECQIEQFWSAAALYDIKTHIRTPW